MKSKIFLIKINFFLTNNRVHVCLSFLCDNDNFIFFLEMYEKEIIQPKLKKKKKKYKIDPLFLFSISFLCIYYFYNKFQSIFLIPFLSLIFHIFFLYNYNKSSKLSLLAKFQLFLIGFLLISSLLLTNFSFSKIIFFFLIHSTIFNQILHKNITVLFTILAELYYFFPFKIKFFNLNISLLLFSSIIPQFCLIFLFDQNKLILFDKFSSFPTKTMIFCLLCDIIIFKTQIERKFFLISLFLYIVKYPKQFFKKLNFTKTDLYNILYLVVSLTMNIHGIIYGLKIGSSSLASSSTLSLYNTLSLCIVLFGAINSRKLPNNKYSYGYKNIIRIFHFVASLLILFSGINLWSDLTKNSLLPSIYVKRPSNLVLLSLIDFLLSLIGALTIGHTKITTFTIIHDIFNSSIALISSLFDWIFNFPAADQLLCVIIVLAIFSTALPNVLTTFNSLIFNDTEKQTKLFISKFKLKDKVLEIFYNKGIPRNSLILKLKKALKDTKDDEKILQEISNFCNQKKIDLTIEFCEIPTEKILKEGQNDFQYFYC